MARHNRNRRNSMRSDNGSGADSEHRLTELEEMLLAITNRKHMMRGENGLNREASLLEALIMKLASSAMNGSVLAQRALLDYIQNAESKNMDIRKAKADHWRELKRDLKRTLDARIAKGEDVSDFVPHPDDIIIEADNTIRFKGPFTLEELAFHRHTLEVIDLLLLQGHYETRYKLHANDNSSSDHENDTSAFLHILFFNQGLPKRMQISEAEIQRRILIPPRLPTKREFKKAILEKYRSLGIKTRKIGCLPPFRQAAALIQGLVSMVIRLIEDARNGQEWSEQQGYQELLWVFQQAGFEIADG